MFPSLVKGYYVNANRRQKQIQLEFFPQLGQHFHCSNNISRYAHRYNLDFMNYQNEFPMNTMGSNRFPIRRLFKTYLSFTMLAVKLVIFGYINPLTD